MNVQDGHTRDLVGRLNVFSKIGFCTSALSLADISSCLPGSPFTLVSEA